MRGLIGSWSQQKVAVMLYSARLNFIDSPSDKELVRFLIGSLMANSKRQVLRIGRRRENELAAEDRSQSTQCPKKHRPPNTFWEAALSSQRSKARARRNGTEGSKSPGPGK